MVAAGAGGTAPLHSGVADKCAVLGDLPARPDDVVPRVVGDLKVVGGIAKYVERGDIARVVQIPVGVLSADGVVGMNVQVAEVRPRRRKSSTMSITVSPPCSTAVLVSAATSMRAATGGTRSDALDHHSQAYGRCPRRHRR